MISRCTDKANARYAQYGGRGIGVCERWRHSFTSFLKDIGPKPTRQHSLDRINNDGNYEPGNCRWATPEEQIANRHVTVWVTVHGERLLLVDAARKLGLHPQALRERVKKGTDIYAPPKGYLRIGDACRHVSEWAKEFGVAQTTIRTRLERGWDPWDAVTMPRAHRHAHRRGITLP